MNNFPSKRDPFFGYASEEEARLHQTIMTDPAAYEKGLLAACIYDSKVAALAEPLVGKDQNGMPIEDFAVPLHSALYKAIKNYHKTTNYAFFNAPSLDGLRLALEREANDDTSFELTIDQVPTGLQVIVEACHLYMSAPAYFSSMSKRGLSCWLQERRLLEYQRRRQAMRWTSEQFSQQWATEQIYLKSMAGTAETQYWYSMDDCLKWEPVKVFLQFPWDRVNRQMGGGLARGDATLLVAATGAGKTVAAAQCAGHFSLKCNAKGVFISTEQKGPGVLPRMVSCFSGVLFKELNKFRTVQLDTLSQGDRALSLAVIERLKQSHFYFRDWKPGDSIISGIKSIVEHYCEKLSPDGTLDYVVMDWIGGSIEHGARDQEETRMRMQHAADTMALLADDLNIVTLATAQANPMQAAKTQQVGGQHIAECKTMHRHFENLIGLSGLQDVSVNNETEDVTARYLPEQYLYIDKSRFGPGGLIPVTRRFHVQRLDDRVKG